MQRIHNTKAVLQEEEINRSNRHTVKKTVATKPIANSYCLKLKCRSKSAIESIFIEN